MADNNFKGGPGGRLKAEEKKNTLYVSNPNDPRLKAYQDSSIVYNAMLMQNKLMGDNKNIIENNIDRINPVKFNTANLNFMKNAAKNGLLLHPIYNNYNEMMKSSIDQKHKDLIKYYKKLGIPDKNIGFYPSPDLIDTKVKPVANYYDGVATSPYYKKPERPVVLVKRPKAEVIEPLAPRQAPVPQFEQPQMIAPVMRPVSVPQTTPMEEPMMEEQVVTERPVGRKPPRAIMPTRQGGWGNQPLLMKLFPKLYER